jgi:hypothetical protein
MVVWEVRFLPILRNHKKLQDMKVTIQVSRYDFEIVESKVIDDSYVDDKYHRSSDEKYIRFLKAHRFDSSPRVFDLYLRLCAENLV